MCVTLDGKIVHNSEIRPYTELVLHRAIYQSREDINAIVHLHSDEIMPFAASNTEIKPVYHLGTPFHQGVPTFTDFDGKHGRLIVTESEAERMAEDLNSCNAQLIENHGPKVVGQDLRDVTVITKYFVKNARYQYEAEQLEETSYYTGSAESLEQMATKVRSTDSINRMWDYLVSNLNDTKGSS
jgi:ribulose-5-phosphate 4-epimerase/fuculose-1-phosphate aldolase